MSLRYIIWVVALVATLASMVCVIGALQGQTPFEVGYVLFFALLGVVSVVMLMLVPEPQSNRIFIVHGHDDQMRRDVELLLTKQGLEPIVLRETPNQGRAIIEKLEDHSDVGFAVVLLSSDDKGYSVRQAPNQAKFRARQNVILELGFFIGKLKRARVCALLPPGDDFEFPSDYLGVSWVPYDGPDGGWRRLVIKELRQAHYKVSSDRL